MAVRTVHCYFKNLTDQTLVLDSHDIPIWGIYTDPWYLPQTIAPGEVGEWRTESDGGLLPQGTEAKATYRIATLEEGTVFIDLWWDNPLIGGNKSYIHTRKDFTGDSSQIFEGANQIDGSPPPNWLKMKDGDVEAWIDAVLFPPYIFANAPIANDANAVFAIRRKAKVSSPLFGPKGSGPYSSQINTSHNTAEWEGMWASNAASVTIVSLGDGSMSASITDTTVNPTLQFQETFRLGQIGWALNALALGVHQDIHTIGRTAASTIIGATSKAIQSENPEGHEHMTAAIFDAVQADLGKDKFEELKAQLVRTSNAAAAVAKLPHSTVLLSHGVCLTLYDDFEAGQKVGGHILYERIMWGVGVTLASERLSFYPMLH